MKNRNYSSQVLASTCNYGTREMDAVFDSHTEDISQAPEPSLYLCCSI